MSKINHIKVIHDSYKNLKVLEKHKLSSKKPNNLYVSDPTITIIEFFGGLCPVCKVPLRLFFGSKRDSFHRFRLGEPFCFVPS